MIWVGHGCVDWTKAGLRCGYAKPTCCLCLKTERFWRSSFVCVDLFAVCKYSSILSHTFVLQQNMDCCLAFPIFAIIKNVKKAKHHVYFGCLGEAREYARSVRGHRSQNPFSGLFWEKAEKRIGVTNIWPGDKVSGGKWHYITQEGDKPNLPLQAYCTQRGREGYTIHRGKESQPLPALSPVSHAQQQLGTLINLSEGSDLFVCKGPGWTPQWLLHGVHTKATCIPTRTHLIFIQVFSFFSSSLSLSLSLSLSPSVRSPRFSFLCINQFWQLPRGVCLMWIFIMINFVWRRYLWYILMWYLLRFFSLHRLPKK